MGSAACSSIQSAAGQARVNKCTKGIGTGRLGEQCRRQGRPAVVWPAVAPLNCLIAAYVAGDVSGVAVVGLGVTENGTPKEPLKCFWQLRMAHLEEMGPARGGRSAGSQLCVVIVVRAASTDSIVQAIETSANRADSPYHTIFPN